MCGWNHNLKFSPHLGQLSTATIPAKKTQARVFRYGQFSHCQTNPLPAPGAFYHAAMKTSPQKANPLPIPPSWFQLHNKHNQRRLSGQFQISSELPLPYWGSHSPEDSFTYGVSFLIYHSAMSEILSHQWQQQPWVSRALTHRKLKPWVNGCFPGLQSMFPKKESLLYLCLKEDSDIPFLQIHVFRQGFSERVLKLHWPKLILTGKMQLLVHRGTVLASNKDRNVLTPGLQQVHRHWETVPKINEWNSQVQKFRIGKLLSRKLAWIWHISWNLLPQALLSFSASPNT